MNRTILYRPIGFVTVMAAGLAALVVPAQAGHWGLGDLNQDGLVNFGDINPFVECLIRGGCGFPSPPLSWTVDPDPLLGPPDIGYLAVLKDQGLYKLWYDHVPGIEVRYTESEDGFVWDPTQTVYYPQCSNDDRIRVTRRGDTLHMWVGAKCADQGNGVDYSVSSDGLAWEWQGCIENWCTYAILPSASGFVAWYLPKDDQPRCYRRATSADGLIWTDHGCVLEPGAPGEFDAELGTLCVIEQYGYYHMWYLCTPENEGRTRYAYASSPDGITWTKCGLIEGFDDLPDRELGSLSVVFDHGTLRMWFYMNQALYYAESTCAD